jgi:hypothetical protein
MGLIHDLRIKAHRKSLRKKLKQRIPPQGRDSVNLKSAHTVGLLFRADDPNTRKLVLQYAERLREQGKQTRLLGYLDKLEEGQELAFKCFSRKDLDWAYRPKRAVVKEFREQPLDLLIHLSLKPTLYAEYICALSKAKLRIGPSTENTYAYDLMIDLPSSARLQDFIEQMEALLGKTNTPYEPA